MVISFNYTYVTLVWARVRRVMEKANEEWKQKADFLYKKEKKEKNFGISIWWNIPWVLYNNI